MHVDHQLNIQPVTAERFEDLAALFHTGLARVCWDMEPRQTAAEDAACRRRWRAEGISRKDGRRQAFIDLLAQAHMPGLLAYREGQPVGCRWDREATTRASSSRGPCHPWTVGMSAVAQQEFIDMLVRDVRKAPDSPNPDAHVVLLEERGGDRRLAIWIGREEAFWLAWRLEGAEGFRPGTYDMTAGVIRALGGQVREVRIDLLSDTTFYATIVLDGGPGVAEVDARPSDALCLALTAAAPIRADRAMVEAVLATEHGARDTGELWEGQDVPGSRALLDEWMRPPEQSAE
jgi:bifunctional DNase/RNase